MFNPFVLEAAFCAARSLVMTRDANGQDDHRPVYLPENRHHWVTNDDVKKPVVDVLRGPIRARMRRDKNVKPVISSDEWMGAHLPGIGATAIVAIVILCVGIAIYSDLAAVFLK